MEKGLKYYEDEIFMNTYLRLDVPCFKHEFHNIGRKNSISIIVFGCKNRRIHIFIFEKIELHKSYVILVFQIMKKFIYLFIFNLFILDKFYFIVQ